MRIVEITSLGDYPDDAGVKELEKDHWEAYMVLGRGGVANNVVAVVTGSGVNMVTAINVMNRKMTLLRDQFDLMNHEAFWLRMEQEQKERMAKLKAALGMGGDPEEDKGALS